MSGDPDSFGARARALREERGWSLFEAVAHLRKERLLKDLDAAISIEDLKSIIKRMITNG